MYAVGARGVCLVCCKSGLCHSREDVGDTGTSHVLAPQSMAKRQYGRRGESTRELDWEGRGGVCGKERKGTQPSTGESSLSLARNSHKGEYEVSKGRHDRHYRRKRLTRENETNAMAQLGLANGKIASRFPLYTVGKVAVVLGSQEKIEPKIR